MMTMLEKLRYLQAPAEGDAAATGTGGTSTADAGAKADEKVQDGGAADTAGAGDKKGETPKDGEKKSILKGSGAGDAGAKTGDKGKVDDSKTGAEAKAKEGAAATEYVVKLPEGVKVDEARLKSFTAQAKGAGITPEQAAQLVAYQVGQEKLATESWAKQGENWYGELEKDGEFGGANLKASEAALQSALRRFDPKGELVQDLEKYGVENLPSLARFLRRVGLAGAEDKGTVDTTRTQAKAMTKEEIRLAKEFPSIKEIQPAE